MSSEEEKDKINFTPIKIWDAGEFHTSSEHSKLLEIISGILPSHLEYEMYVKEKTITIYISMNKMDMANYQKLINEKLIDAKIDLKVSFVL